MTDELLLIEPGIQWKSAFLDMAAEFVDSGDERYQRMINDFDSYLKRLARDAQPENLPIGHVPQTTYWGAVGTQLIGSIRLRHELTPTLRQIGGHIGYVIRPSWRGQGYGTALLRHTLDRARHIGLHRVLITCDTNNIGSARVIEKNSGKLQDQYMIDGYRHMISRYWIDL